MAKILLGCLIGSGMPTRGLTAIQMLSRLGINIRIVSLLWRSGTILIIQNFIPSHTMSNLFNFLVPPTITTPRHVPSFTQDLKAYLEMLKLSATNVSVCEACTQVLPFEHLDVYYSFKFSPEQLEEGVDLKDIVKASPLNGGQFDTVIVMTSEEAESVSLEGY